MLKFHTAPVFETPVTVSGDRVGISRHRL